MKKAFLVTLLFVMAAAGSASAQTISAPSAWRNESGSVLYIQAIDPVTGQLSGFYVNRAAGYSCQNYPYPATGWVYSNSITFTVIWQSSHESCASITSWTGFLANGNISTLWQLVNNGSTGTNQIVKGSNTFSRVAASTKSFVNPQ